MANTDSYLICAVAGKNKQEYGKINVTSIWGEDVIKFTMKNIENIISELKGTKVGKTDKKFVRELISTTVDKNSEIVPTFPTNSFVMNFVENITKQKIEKLYGEYSYFVHSYVPSWQTFPFSSVLEYKILRHEIDKFERLVRNILLWCSINPQPSLHSNNSILKTNS